MSTPADSDVTTSASLLALVKTALLNATDAGPNVFVPGDVPTWSGIYPSLHCQAPLEQKTSQGRGTTQFTVVTSIRITARTQAASGAGDSGASVAEAAAQRLGRQVEIAVIGSDPIAAVTSQVPFVQSEMKVTAEGKQHLAELVISIGLEFYQGPEAFIADAGVPLLQMTARVVEAEHVAQTGLDLSLPQDPPSGEDPDAQDFTILGIPTAT